MKKIQKTFLKFLLLIALSTFALVQMSFAQVYVQSVYGGTNNYDSNYTSQTTTIQNNCVYNPSYPTSNLSNCINTPIDTRNNQTGKYPELCSILNRPLKLGDSGQDVKRLQVVLGQEGVAYLNATGFFGPSTRSAVKAFQVRAGIYPVGKVGPQTLQRMKVLWCENDILSVPSYPTNPGNQEMSFYPSVSNGNNITLTWISPSNSNRCSINGETVNASGSKIYTIYSETSYTLSCYDYNNREYRKTISVKPNQNSGILPTVSVSINPTAALIGQGATIYWTSQNTNYCTTTMSGDRNQTTGSFPIVVLSGQQAYTVTCYNSSGQSASQTIYTNGNTQTNNNQNYQNITLNLVADITNLNLNDTINFTATIRNNGSTNIRFQNSSSICSGSTRDVTMTIDGRDFDSFFNIPQAYCALIYNPQPTYIDLGPGQTYTRTFTSNALNNSSFITNGNHVALATLTLRNENGIFGTVNSNSTNFTINNSQNNNGTAGIFSVTPTNNSVNAGQAVTLYLTGTNISTCNLNGGIYSNYNLPLVQTQQYPNYASSANIIVTPTQTASYVFNCTGTNGGNTSQTVYITVNGSTSGVPTVTAYSQPTSINSGSQIVLNWYSSNANSCAILSNGNSVASNQNVSGTYAFTPTQSTNYEVRCTNTSSGQVASSYAYVTVNNSTTSNVTSISVLANANRNVNIQVYKQPYNSCSTGYIDWGDGQQNTNYTYPNVSYGSACQINIAHSYNSTGTFVIRVYENNIMVVMQQINVQ